MRKAAFWMVIGAGTAALPAVAPPRSVGAAPAQAATETREPGLYMRFETTHGNISCKLYENEAPNTVRTIVGLAIGKQARINPKTGQPAPRKPFYDGLIFHRVIPQFMIQGGDPEGTGMGGPAGPGFPFLDEFVPTLQFDVPGRLAMANSGPGTNGSQFFITEVPTPHLNNRHTIFGHCGRPEVVRAIARVPANPTNRPLEPVVMKRVVVERVGQAPPNAPEALAVKRGTPAKMPAKTGKAPAKTPAKKSP